jgi:hypothetical protein
MESKCTRTPSLRWCWILLAFLIAPGSLSAQENLQVSAPPIEMLKLKWEKQVRLPRNFDPSVIPTGGTFSDPSRSSTTTANTGTTTASSGASGPASGDSGLPNPFPATPARMSVDYVYSMKIRNASSKIIEGIAWDYLFLDPNSLTELGRHQFLSYAKLPTNKSITLQGQLRSPPTRVIRTSDSGKQAHPKLIERSVIQCVLYADDTVWRNPNARGGVCELLKNSKALMKRKHGAG